MTNRYGAKLDRNGYAPSIVHDGPCYFCGAHETTRHEIFYGSGRREKCKALGLWASVCPICHRLVHDELLDDEKLRQKAQEAAMERYGWDESDFITEFGRNYL